MSNLAYKEVEETSVVEPRKPVLAYTREENRAKENARLVESIVDYLLARGSMPA